MNTNDFTLAIPIYNDGKYLRETLESCVNQASSIFLYDNCSTDETAEICSEYANKYRHVKYIRHDENLGAFENFRQSLFACKTEYFMWLGAHDLISENYVAPLLSALKNNQEAGLAVGKIMHINEDGSQRDKVTDLRKWNDAIQNEQDGFKRMAAFIKDHFGSKKHDSFLFQGVFRTEILRKAWFDKPCLAFDDAVLAKAALYGKIIYDNQAIYYGRWFKKTRKKEDEAKRIFRGNKVPQANAALTRNTMVFEVVRAITEAADKRSDTKSLFELLALVQKYVENPRRARKNRNRKIIAVILLLIIIGVSLCVF